MDTTQSSTTNDTHSQTLKNQSPTLDYRSSDPSASNFGFLAGAMLAGILFGLPFALISYVGFIFDRNSSFIALAGSPLSLTGFYTTNLLIPLFCIPIVWIILGGLAAKASTPFGAVIFALAVTCHYLVNFYFFHGGVHFGRASRQTVWAGLTLYVAGQVALWLMFAYALRRPKPKTKEARYRVKEL
jgi:hypothetical protein